MTSLIVGATQLKRKQARENTGPMIALETPRNGIARFLFRGFGDFKVRRIT